MPQQLALFICVCLSLWLLYMDCGWRKAGSRALLIPGIWLAIIGSRPISYWFGGRGGSEANPIDTLVFAVLIVAAVLILSRRGLRWMEVARQNKALFLVYAYLLLSVFWSEMPATSGKRIVKDFGCVAVGLVFLTQPNPAISVRAVFLRVAYLLFPLSVVLIKFYPGIGRSFSRAGEAMFVGVTTQKNSLGLVVLVFSIMILWDLIEVYREENRAGKQLQVAMRAGMLLMGLWLLKTCDSQTSMLCLVAGAALFWGGGRLARMRNGRPILVILMAAMVCLVLMDKTLGLSESVIRALGRNPNLTGRTEIWRLVLKQDTDPVLGEGFHVFWDGAKGKAVVNSFMRVNSAHNGYLELYMDGGLVGCGLLGVVLLATGRRSMDKLFRGETLGKVSLVYLFIAVLYNLSESSFLRMDVLWFTFLLGILACPAGRGRWRRGNDAGSSEGNNEGTSGTPLARGG